MPTEKEDSHSHAYLKGIISGRSLRRWAAVPPLIDNLSNSAHAETSNGVAAVAVATNNCSNANSRLRTMAH